MKARKVITMILLLVLGVMSIAYASSNDRDERRARRQAKRGCHGSAKMIGYGTDTWRVLKNNR